MWISLFIFLLFIIVVIYAVYANQSSARSEHDYHHAPNMVHTIGPHIAVPIGSSNSSKCTIETRTQDGKTVFRTSGKDPYDVFDRHIEKIWSKAIESEKPDTINKYLLALEEAASEALRIGINFDDTITQHYINGIHEHLQQSKLQVEADLAERKADAAYKKWFRKIEPLFDLDLYGLRVGWEYRSAIDLQSKKRKSLKLFEDGLLIAVENNQTDDFFYEINEALNLSNSIDQVKDRAGFEEVIDRVISEMEPVAAKRKAVQQQILALLNIKSPGMQRSVLLAHNFDNVTKEELKTDYDYLLRKKKLTEEKRSDRYYVFLPDKKSNHTKPTEKDTTIPSMSNDAYTGITNSADCTVAHTNDLAPEHSDPVDMPFVDFVSMLKESGIKYVDKTPNNGNLWIEYTEQTENLSVLSIDGIHPKKAAKTRHFDDAPGWYIKPNK